jgi:sugar/nucleoside kinase (ribokinase family)
MSESIEVLAVGHICLDIIPAVSAELSFDPGRLVEAGPATLCTGGSVSNTGLSLHRLGVKTRLIGKLGTGIFGRAALEILEQHAPGSTATMSVSESESTSYTVVLSLRGSDRMFLHSPGANKTFGSEDVSDEALAETKILHLGYPPLLARMYANEGEELVTLFRRAKEAGATTSLDLSLPDADAPSGAAPWDRILERVLPYTDFFLPSVEELLFMLDRKLFESLRGAIFGHLPEKLVGRLATRSIELGAKVVGVKIGSRGFYLRMGSDLSGMGRAKPNWEPWTESRIWQPCFSVNVAGTTGAGDATIAGFLMGVLRGFSPIEATQAGVGVGACCCEEPDAVSGVRCWDDTAFRILSGWDSLDVELSDDWHRESTAYVRRPIPGSTVR